MDPQTIKYCRFCMEAIHPDARICRVCQSRQQPSVFASVGNFIKWVGGIAAVTSLIIGVWQVNSLFVSWTEKRQAIEELVTASQLQDKTGNFKAAWQLMKKALDIDQTSALAREKQVLLAMKWLRHIGFRGIKFEEDKFITDTILPVLYRGVVINNPNRSASILAHIGLAGYILRSDQIYDIDPELHYKKALERDPGNVFANALMGQWLMESQRDTCNSETLDKALGYFASGEKKKTEQQIYVIKIKFDTLLKCGELGTTTALKEANTIRLHKMPFNLDVRMDLIKLYKPLWYMGDTSGRWDSKIKTILSALSPKDLMDTYIWLHQGIDYKNGPTPYNYSESDHRVVMIRLKRLRQKNEAENKTTR